jgi:hypothetical protein
MWCFDLLELDGQDMRREPIEVRKATLTSVLRSCRTGLQFNQHLEHHGDIVFRHACKMGLEGIVSKRLGWRYVSGRSLKFKNPAAPATSASSRKIGDEAHAGREAKRANTRSISRAAADRMQRLNVNGPRECSP